MGDQFVELGNQLVPWFPEERQSEEQLVVKFLGACLALKRTSAPLVEMGDNVTFNNELMQTMDKFERELTKVKQLTGKTYKGHVHFHKSATKLKDDCVALKDKVVAQAVTNGQAEVEKQAQELAKTSDNQATLARKAGLADIGETDLKAMKTLYGQSFGAKELAEEWSAAVKKANDVSKLIKTLRQKATVHKVELQVGDGVERTIQMIRVDHVTALLMDAFSGAEDGVSFRARLMEKLAPAMKQYKFSAAALPGKMADIYRAGLNMELPVAL